MTENISSAEIASRIDHTNLKPDITLEEVKQLCDEAVKHGFAAICIPPIFTAEAVQVLEGKPVSVATVIGFPMGYNATSAKVEEIKNTVDKEVDELDVVINIAAVKNKKWAYVRNDIQSVTTAAHLNNKVVKIIIETGLLSKEEIGKVCELCTEAEVDYVKTSTGFNSRGATVQDVELLRKLLPDTIKIKASGGIREREFAEELIRAGADRLGSSSGINLIQ